MRQGCRSRGRAARVGSFRDGIDAAEVQFQAAFGGRQQFRHQLEHLHVARPHLVQVVQQSAANRPLRVAHERGEPRQICRPLRQLVHLAVGGHLQAVLDAAEEAVGGAQFARGTARHVAGTHQHAQCAQRVGTRNAGSRPPQTS